ncbi:MAG: transporter, partial [Rhodocyclales bacterium]|nr:transporter [Rhodocyclales bacterium]
LVQAQHAAGTALLSDVALAESQLATAQAQAVDLDAQRSQLEHAIAILTGRAPADFSLPPATAAQPFTGQLPVSPVGVPSQLLERRPDIAAAERRVAVANANIGVARAAMFPTLTLSARGGFSAGDLSRLFDTPSRIWSLGAALAQTLFDGGLHRARGAQAVAAYDAAVADYKQTVLSGFQQVEDNLSTLRVLDQETGLQARAVQSSQLAERLALSQYRAGTSSYLNVITTQVLSLSNQRTAVQLRGRQLAASVSLITATGGSWNAGGNATSAQKDLMQDSMQDSTQKPTL